MTASNKTRWHLAALSASLLWAAGAPIQAQEARIGHDPQVLISALTTPAIARLTVSSAQVTEGALSVDATQYGANLFPGLTWSAAQIWRDGRGIPAPLSRHQRRRGRDPE